jgi:hypothetical protein
LIAGAFKASTRQLTSRLASNEWVPTEGIGQGIASREEGLARLLAAIADEVQAWAAGARAGIAAEFAGKILYARQYLPKHLVAGAVRALVEARQAALASFARLAMIELSARQQTAIRAYRAGRRPSRPLRRHSKPTPPHRPKK